MSVCPSAPKRLLPAGQQVLSAYLPGTEMPAAGLQARIFISRLFTRYIFDYFFEKYY